MLASDIIIGKHDAELDGIITAVRSRQKALAAANVAAVTKGDTVVLSDDIRPRYLAGQHATVERVNQTTMTLRLTDPTTGRRFGSGPFRCPVTLIAGKAAA